jgi:hypothetical protein
MKGSDAEFWASTSVSQVAAGLLGSCGFSTVPHGWRWCCFSRAPSSSSSSPALSVPESGPTGGTSGLTRWGSSPPLGRPRCATGPATWRGRDLWPPPKRVLHGAGASAPTWTRVASVLAERETLFPATLAARAHGWRRGNHVVTPLARLVGGVAVRAVLIRGRAASAPGPYLVAHRSSRVKRPGPARRSCGAGGNDAWRRDAGPATPPQRSSPHRRTRLLSEPASLGGHWASDVLGGILTAVLWRHLARGVVRRQPLLVPTPGRTR